VNDLFFMSDKILWQKPKLHENSMHHRKVSWLELFFDLVFVVVISELVHLLSQNLSLKMVGNYIFLFMPAWWIWIGATFYNDRFETEGLESRIFTFMLMIPVAGLAIFVHHVHLDSVWGYGMCYIIARVCIMLLWARAAVHEKRFRPVGIVLMSGYSLGVILFFSSLFAGDSLRYILWSLALLCDLSTPLFTLRRQLKLPHFNLSKLTERLGLFVLIVIGETLVGVIRGVARHDHFNFKIFSEGILGAAISFAIWWIYFDSIARRSPKPSHRSTFAWSYLHLILVMSIGSAGASLLPVLTSKHHTPSDPARILLAFSIAVALVFIGLIELNLKKEEEGLINTKITTTLKFLSGFLIFLIGVFGHEIHAFSILAFIFGALLVPIVYSIIGKVSVKEGSAYEGY
jgi:low temperature requirement protein LtrA